MKITVLLISLSVANNRVAAWGFPKFGNKYSYKDRYQHL